MSVFRWPLPPPPPTHPAPPPPPLSRLTLFTQTTLFCTWFHPWCWYSWIVGQQLRRFQAWFFATAFWHAGIGTSRRGRGLGELELSWWGTSCTPLMVRKSVVAAVVCVCVCVHFRCHRATWIHEHLFFGGAGVRPVRLEADSSECTSQHWLYMPVQKGRSGKLTSLPKARSHHLLSNALRSLEFYQGKVFRKHPRYRLLLGFGFEMVDPSFIPNDHVHLDCPLLKFWTWHRCILPILYLPVRAYRAHHAYGLRTPG